MIGRLIKMELDGNISDQNYFSCLVETTLLLLIGFNLQFKFPANEMKFRVISDSKKQKKVGAYSVWVSKKPFISKTATLKRRQEIEFVFKGGADSIYSNIKPQIYVVNNESRSNTR